jgi:hypothetical protein
MDAEKLEGNNAEGSGLEEHMAHWADVLDRWVKGVDTRLGRQDDGEALPLNDAEVGASAEQ